MESFLIPVCILAVAFLYSSVGHGGASGYLGILALLGMGPQVLRPSALLLNILVSGIAFYQYYRKGFFRGGLFIRFGLVSVPAAFIGGTLSVDPAIYSKILAVCLLAAVFRMFLTVRDDSRPKKTPPLFAALAAGVFLGFISGVIGVGGGIFLSPMLLLFHWADIKETAAVSSLFIFVNSAAGIFGIWSAGMNLHTDFYLWVIAAVIGAVGGSFYGSSRFTFSGLKYALAIVLAFAGVKLLM